jgi:hypothetical protein
MSVRRTIKIFTKALVSTAQLSTNKTPNALPNGSLYFRKKPRLNIYTAKESTAIIFP